MWVCTYRKLHVLNFTPIKNNSNMDQAKKASTEHFLLTAAVLDRLR